jgi:hypothetical protein
MDQRFDWHQWNATTCTTAEEIERFLSDNNVYGKKIRSVNVIGMAENMEKSNYTRQLRTTLANAGVSYELMDSGNFPQMEQTLLPCEVSVCEPVVITFEDDSTLELQIYRNGAVKIAVNQISASLNDGINFSNFNANLLFEKLTGCSIRGISLIDRKTESQSGRSAYVEKRSRRKLQFDIAGENGFYLENSYDNWYRFGLCEHHRYTEFGWETAKVTFKTLKAATFKKQQIAIVEGHDSSSFFWIMPVKAISKSQGWKVDVEEYRPEEISIEEDDVGSMLYYFLDQIFDPALQEPFRDVEMEGLNFKWNLEYNVFTYDSIKKMIATIREYAQLLQSDYDNPKLAPLKEGFYACQFDREYYYYKERPSEDETIRNNIYVAIDFYERFCNRMERMMEHTPQFGLISFMGP